MKKQKQTDQPCDPLFVSKCHPQSTVDYREIVEDADSSKVIAVVGRYHACMGIQRVTSCAHNIDKLKLAKALHGNSDWFLNSDVVKELRLKPKYLHGELSSSFIPVQKQTSQVNVSDPPERSFTEPQDADHEVPF